MIMDTVSNSVSIRSHLHFYTLKEAQVCVFHGSRSVGQYSMQNPFFSVQINTTMKECFHHAHITTAHTHFRHRCGHPGTDSNRYVH